MLRNAELCIFRAVRSSLFLWKKERTTLDQELSRPYSALSDEQFFLRHAPLFGDLSHCGEADEIANALLTPTVVWELFGVSTTLTLTGSKKFQKNPHYAS